VTVFSLLVLLLMQGIPDLLRPAAALRPWRRNLHVAAFCLTAATALGLCVLSLPAYGVELLVPGLAMGAAFLQVGGEMLRAMSRRRWIHWPVRAVASRLGPWVLLCACAMLLTMVILDAGLGGQAGTLAPTRGASLWPDGAFARWPLLALAWLGGLVLLVRTGLRLGRRGRLDADLLLAAHCAVLLVYYLLHGEAIDGLPAAVPAAVLVVEGVVFLGLFGGGMYWRRRRRA
jgi:hypothetical protein